MAFIKVEKVAIRGISGCVPAKVEENIDLPFYAPGEAEQVIEKIGIERRHVATADITVADMCYKAAEKLIEELGWEKDSIDLLALCTQCPDYLNQPTSFLVHDQLGLPESTMCVDYYHGCPGWAVSMASVCSMLSSGQIKRAILLDGDSVSKSGTPNNREERPLFGDAGTATALEFSESASPMLFNIGTLSEDGRALITVIGGSKNPFNEETFQRELKRRAGLLSMEELASKMDSMDVFSFAITKVPKALKKLCSEFEIDLDKVDRLVLHQANKLIVENIAKRMKVGMDRVPLGLKNYGNTTSASVPLALVTECHDALVSGRQRILACGFGTGLAWGALYFETENIVCPSIVEI